MPENSFFVSETFVTSEKIRRLSLPGRACTPGGPEGAHTHARGVGTYGITKRHVSDWLYATVTCFASSVCYDIGKANTRVIVSFDIPTNNATRVALC